MPLNQFAAGLWLGLVLGSAQAYALGVEALSLGEFSATAQVYKLQERGDRRVFASSAAGFKRAQIFTQSRVDGLWQAPVVWRHDDPRWRDSDPHLSSDGKTLTFISDRPELGAEAALGHWDLFESRLIDGQWGPPTHLPARLQSSATELGPQRYGGRLYFASDRPGGPSKLSVYSADGDGLPVALPAPINVGALNSDFTLSPDGRYALWWSRREGSQDGDIYLAERVGDSFGPALRLPEPINGPDFEFGPSVSADGQWLAFASTRPGPQQAGLARQYRVGWPALLASLGPAAQAYSEAELSRQVSALWRAMSHAAGQSADVEGLARLMAGQAQVWGQSLKAHSLGARVWSKPDFLEMLRAPGAEGFFECELKRELRRYGGHAQVYSWVASRRRPDQAMPDVLDVVGVNSMQWQLGPQGWQLLSLHYALQPPGADLPAGVSVQGECLELLPALERPRHQL